MIVLGGALTSFIHCSKAGLPGNDAGLQVDDCFVNCAAEPGRLAFCAPGSTGPAKSLKVHAAHFYAGEPGAIPASIVACGIPSGSVSNL